MVLDSSSQGSASHPIQNPGRPAPVSGPRGVSALLQHVAGLEPACSSMASVNPFPPDPGFQQWPRILLAEDHRDLQEVLARQLGLMGLEVVGVTNGRDAVDLALAVHQAGNSFALVLMDLEMPVVDGYEATRRLREAAYPGPILALSATLDGRLSPGEHRRGMQ